MAVVGPASAAEAEKASAPEEPAAVEEKVEEKVVELEEKVEEAAADKAE